VERDLVERRITSPDHLGIMGGSNGGLLMGVMLNQHPEMINAAVVQVPLLDMLRYDQLLAGASWVDEYGSPSNPEERAFLETITPYQNLHARDDFPTAVRGDLHEGRPRPPRTRAQIRGAHDRAGPAGALFREHRRRPLGGGEPERSGAQARA
jgi:prolyl oligopeptidase PreP (S9A serine peptidase family)